MIGDNHHLKPEYTETALNLWDQLTHHPAIHQSKMVIGIAGESGSGKTISALALKDVAMKNGKSVVVVHLDDFFILPPKSNHEARLANIAQVGLGEVNMVKLQQVIANFKSNEKQVHQPLVNYNENAILDLTWNAQLYDVLIVEGTYTLFLENLDVKIFIDRNYTQTHQDRITRGREMADPFIEEVLAIEHNIIKQQKDGCDLCIQSDFTIENLLQS